MKKNKENTYKNFKVRERTLSFFGRSQYRDWIIILTTFFSVFIIVVILALFSYFEMKNETDYFGSDSVSVNDKKINKEALTSVIVKMEGRENNFNELRKAKPAVSDPAI
jgi:hypothetical protein